VFNFKCTSASVSYVGWPTIGMIVGCGKLSMILSRVDGMVATGWMVAQPKKIVEK